MRGGRSARVLGDEAMLVTAVDNLVANAIAYSPAGSPVTISRSLPSMKPAAAAAHPE